MPAHIGRSGSATSAPPLGSYHHLSAPSTPHQIPRSPRGGYQPQEEPFPSTPQTILTQARHIPTPQQAASRLEVDQARITGPPFFVIFNGSKPGVFTDWYVSSSLNLLIGFSSYLGPLFWEPASGGMVIGRSTKRDLQHSRYMRMPICMVDWNSVKGCS